MTLGRPDNPGSSLAQDQFNSPFGAAAEHFRFVESRPWTSLGSRWSSHTWIPTHLQGAGGGGWEQHLPHLPWLPVWPSSHPGLFRVLRNLMWAES